MLNRAATEQTEFLVLLAEQADLSATAGLPTKLEKGRYVYETLTGVATRTQEPVLLDLKQRGVAHQSFWVANMIWVRGDLAAVQAMAARADVARIDANPTVQISEPAVSLSAQAAQGPSAIEWNISKVHAPDVWAAGFTGQGVVIGGQTPAISGIIRRSSAGIAGGTGQRHRTTSTGMMRFAAVAGAVDQVRPSHAMIMVTALTRWAQWSATTEPATRSAWHRAHAGSDAVT